MTRKAFRNLLDDDESLTAEDRFLLQKTFDQTEFDADSVQDLAINLSDFAVSYLAYNEALIQYLIQHLPDGLKASDPAVVGCDDNSNLLRKIFQQIQSFEPFDDGKSDVDLHKIPFDDQGSLIVESASDLNDRQPIDNENLDRLISYGSIAVHRLLFGQRNGEIDDVYFKYIGTIWIPDRYFTVITYQDIGAILTAFVKNDAVKWPTDARTSFDNETKWIIDHDD